MANQVNILVVEDEEHLGVGIKYNLEAEGYQVSLVGSGVAALRRFDQEPPIDLLVLDIMLPGMSGYQLCETLREAGHDVPILMLSARVLPEDRARGFDVGADQYLTTPFDLEELLSRVKNLLNLRQRFKGKAEEIKPLCDEFRFANAHVNFLTHEATVNDEPIRLTKLELDLLRYFISNEGRVITRDELLESVWHMPPHANTRAPDQFLRRLRKTFETDPSKPEYFLTVRDAGYRFVSGNDE